MPQEVESELLINLCAVIEPSSLFVDSGIRPPMQLSQSRGLRCFVLLVLGVA